MKHLLLQTIYNNEDNLLETVKALLDQGHNPNAITEYNESPLRVASNNGRFDVVKLLLSRGADEAQLGWPNLFHVIAFGNIEELEEAVTGETDLNMRDYWNRTPFLFAILVGDTEKAAMLIESGADTRSVGHCGRTPLNYAIERDNAVMLQWLIQRGFDIEQTDDFGNTPLIDAAENGATACVRTLIDQGADIFRANSIPNRAIEVAANLDIVSALLEAGADLSDISKEMRAKMLGYQVERAPDISREEYFKGRYRTFGKTNPELSTNRFWHSMVQCGGSAFQAVDKFEEDRDACSLDTEPVWSFERYGKSITLLPDGRYIEIAGEHEDHYDPDFCIYNDVLVHDGDGRCAIYTYPREVFPPTDFHSATLVGEHIYVIGSLGYVEDRRPGYTPVFRLNINTLQMERIETTGDMPGWINSHKALHEDDQITISGGTVEVETLHGKRDHIGNKHSYCLCLKTMEWKRLK